MSEENNNIYEVESLDLKVKGLTGYVIRLKLAKDKSAAEKRMLIMSIIFFGISLYFFAKAAGLV